MKEHVLGKKKKNQEKFRNKIQVFCILFLLFEICFETRKMQNKNIDLGDFVGHQQSSEALPQNSSGWPAKSDTLVPIAI